MILSRTLICQALRSDFFSNTRMNDGFWLPSGLTLLLNHMVMSVG